MVKKGLHSIVWIWFCLMSTGAMASLHYCHDALADISWFSESAQKCPCDSERSSCCDNLILHYEHEKVTKVIPPAIPSGDGPLLLEITLLDLVEPEVQPVVERLEQFDTSPPLPLWLYFSHIRLPDSMIC
jgi:hypothetical protein